MFVTTSVRESQISLRFSPRRAFFEIHGCRKSAIHVITSKWSWTLIQKYPITIKSSLYRLSTYPRGPNFGPFRSTIDQQFSMHRAFNFPIDYHVNCRKKRTKKKLPNILKMKFFNSFTTFKKDAPREYTWVPGSESCLHFQRCRWHFSSHMVITTRGPGPLRSAWPFLRRN